MSLYEALKKEIAQYSLDGKFIRTWSSIKEAQEALNLNSIYNNISGNSKYCGDYIWRKYTGDTSNIEPVVKKEKVVYQFDLQGNLLKVWKSLTEATKQFSNTDSAKSAIHNNCVNIVRQAYGYYWSFKNKFDYKPYGVAVAKYNDEGIFLESYHSITHAAISNNIANSSNIIAAISGRQKRCGGFRWRYFYGNTSNIKPLKDKDIV